MMFKENQKMSLEIKTLRRMSREHDNGISKKLDLLVVELDKERQKCKALSKENEKMKEFFVNFKEAMQSVKSS
jgi:hypothetical protein